MSNFSTTTTAANFATDSNTADNDIANIALSNGTNYNIDNDVDSNINDGSNPTSGNNGHVQKDVPNSLQCESRTGHFEGPADILGESCEEENEEAEAEEVEKEAKKAEAKEKETEEIYDLSPSSLQGHIGHKERIHSPNDGQMKQIPKGRTEYEPVIKHGFEKREEEEPSPALAFLGRLPLAENVEKRLDDRKGEMSW
eukprot:CAMPEP_0175084772 /NCGR_PEP_ID=MMETSP0052_2-20121109/28263_1 /TAXON_ID=51329 ORGANISM="Polytomella parva, Strain SAG 63-3" /NCGR_SAMPLE_ID=MMETSP0052_2 /ASSEMBLY_ACC=CAM_ASM_000194 /LENGTH=197 /DNA_ID=CAMNT_0016356649 /DNA_START=142 /DNA_END=732 /DNA_ORIENTATION=-